MKNLILISIAALILTGCSGDGTLKIINRTEHEIYVSINDTDYTLTGSTDPENNPVSLAIKLDAGSDFPSNPRKTYTLFLQGETFDMWDDFNDIVVPSTEIDIVAGETTSVYCDPTTACVRITNQSTQDIVSAWYLKSTEINPILIPGSQNISPQGSIYYRIDYAVIPTDYYYYTFQVMLADSTMLEYGDEFNFLYKDDLFHIVVE